MIRKQADLPDEDLDATWRALSSPLRRRILDLLLEGPMTTGELSDRFTDLSRFAVMQHMKVLEQAGLVLVRREGRRRFNYMNPVPIQEIHDRWVTRYTKPWAEGLVDLRDELEGRPRAKRRTSSRR